MASDRRAPCGQRIVPFVDADSQALFWPIDGFTTNNYKKQINQTTATTHTVTQPSWRDTLVLFFGLMYTLRIWLQVVATDVVCCLLFTATKNADQTLAVWRMVQKAAYSEK